MRENEAELTAAWRAAAEKARSKLGVDVSVDWGLLEQMLRADFSPALGAIYQQALGRQMDRYTQARLPVDWNVVDVEAARWAEEYQYPLITQINDSTRRQVGQAINRWIDGYEGNTGFPSLVEDIRRIVPDNPFPFIRDRARLIAQTETTRVYADARLAGMRAAGLNRQRWRTAMDELVCPICAPLGLAEGGEGAVGTNGVFLHPSGGDQVRIPAHPGCRCWLVEDTEELEQLAGGEVDLDALLAQPEAGFPYPVSSLTQDRSAPEAGVGAHTKMVYADPDGGRWLFKPQDEFRATGDVVAYDLAQALGHDAAETHIVTIGNRLGSIQRLRPIRSSLSGLDVSSLTDDQLVQLQQEHIFDWLIGNHDSHEDNILLQPDGRLLGIDKGQLFKFYNRDSLDWSYNPNNGFHGGSVYNKLLARFAGGQDVRYFPPDRPEIRAFIRRIESLDDDTFRAIIRPYAETTQKAGFLAYGDVESFLNAAVRRKNSIGADFEAIYQKASKARQSLLSRVVSAEALTPIDSKLVREIGRSNWQGKAMMIDGEDIENMSALIYRVEGDGTMVEFKVRPEAEARMLARIRQYSGGPLLPESVNDPYWADILKAAKSYNAHLKPGHPVYDGAIPAHTQELINNLAQKLAAAANAGDPAAIYYKNYVNYLKAEVDGLKPLGGQVGNFLDQYKPAPPAAASSPVRRSGVGVSPGSPMAAGVRNRNGRIYYEAGNDQAFRGSGLNIDWNNGIRANYTPHSGDNYYSKQGRMQVQIDGDLSGGRLNDFLNGLNEIGLDGRLGTRDDMELMYLAKTAYARAHVTPADVGVTTAMNARQRIDRYRDWWNRTLGVDDVTQLPGYKVDPVYDSPAASTGAKSGEFGMPHWRRFDVGDADLAQLDGYSLGHGLNSLYGGGPTLEKLQMILEANGSLISTEEKFRLGIPLSTTSPEKDQVTGGASYAFTRIHAPAGLKSSPYNLFFSPELLLDTDTISYDHDKFGDVHPGEIQADRLRNVNDWRDIAIGGRRSRPTNETIIKRSISLTDHLVGVRCETAAEKQAVIALLRQNGITRLGGKPLSQAVWVHRTQ